MLHKTGRAERVVKTLFVYGNKWGNMPDDVSNCPDNCVISKQFSDSDIILWHVHTRAEPIRSKPSQVIIAFGMEPKNLNRDNFLSKNINISSSYRLDFELPFLYLDYKFIETCYNLKIPNETEFNSMGDILFISSNCYEKERNDFVKRLSSEIILDSRGKCINNSLSLTGNWLTIEPQVMMKYKFYLGFDKDLNSDYVSEKFQTGFLINSVPV